MVTVNSYLNGRADFYTPERSYTDQARNRRASIESKLKKDLNINSLIETGSLTHGTGLWYYSDVDYFVRFTDSKPDPATALQRIKASMQAIYPSTNIRISSPAVKLNFSAGVSVELVPAYKMLFQEMYSIPNPASNSGWMESNPPRHLDYVSAANNRQAETKKIARLLKLWKYMCSVPVSSFYLEMRTAQYMNGQYFQTGVLDGLTGVFGEMHKDGFSSFRDPTYTVNYIEATSAPSRLVEAKSKLKSAVDNLMIANLHGDSPEAVFALQRVFGSLSN